MNTESLSMLCVGHTKLFGFIFMVKNYFILVFFCLHVYFVSLVSDFSQSTSLFAQSGRRFSLCSGNAHRDEDIHPTSLYPFLSTPDQIEFVGRNMFHALWVVTWVLPSKLSRDIFYLLQQALAERHQLQEQNYQLQHKLSEHFRRKKADDVRHEENRNMSDQEQRYLKFMGTVYNRL